MPQIVRPKPYWQTTDQRSLRLYLGNATKVLLGLPKDHFHCVVTSPPYYGLRSYLPKGHKLKPLEIGSEATPDEYIAKLVRVFSGVRRVMHPTGLLFLNLGDSYGGVNGQLLNMPHCVAEALRADGWHWRQTIVWAKPSPMPESVRGWRWERCQRRSWPDADVATNKELRRDRQQGRDFGKPRVVLCPGCSKCEPHDGYVLRKGKGRCTTAHEYIFVLAKSPLYFWNSAAFVENATPAERVIKGKTGSLGQAIAMGRKPSGNAVPGSIIRTGDTRNPRSVWTVAAEPTSVKHFAAYPTELVRRCLRAATSDGGCCSVCGEPYAPVVKSKQLMRYRPNDRTSRHEAEDGVGSCGNTVAGVDTKILGHRATCSCDVDSVPCRVLDPFVGTGRTLKACVEMGREGVGIDLNRKYLDGAIGLLEGELYCRPGLISQVPNKGKKR